MIDWNPRYLFDEVFENPTEVDFFLNNICTSDWNEEQDGGRAIAEGTMLLQKEHPEYAAEIAMYYDQWTKMLGGPIIENVEIFETLRNEGKFQLFALTNWSAETFPIAQERYEFLSQFDGIVVSGEEKMRKPQAAIYQLILHRYDLDARHCIFIDDNLRNVQAARSQGIPSIHLPPKTSLKDELRPYILIKD